MCHSAVHSDTHDTGRSTLIEAIEIEIFYFEDSPFNDDRKISIKNDKKRTSPTSAIL